MNNKFDNNNYYSHNIESFKLDWLNIWWVYLDYIEAVINTELKNLNFRVASFILYDHSNSEIIPDEVRKITDELEKLKSEQKESKEEYKNEIKEIENLISRNKILMDFDSTKEPLRFERKIENEKEENTSNDEAPSIFERISKEEYNSLEEQKSKLLKELELVKKEKANNICMFEKQLKQDLKEWLDREMFVLLRKYSILFLNLEQTKQKELKTKVYGMLNSFTIINESKNYRELVKTSILYLCNNLEKYLDTIRLHLITITESQETSDLILIKFYYSSNNIYSSNDIYREITFTKEEERLLANIEFNESRIKTLNSKIKELDKKILPEKALSIWENL